MFVRFERSWNLCRECFALIRADQTLLLFPLMSVIAMVLIVATFAIPLVPLLPMLQGDPAHAVPGLAYVALFLFYWLQFSVVFFFNTAVVAVALRRFDGQPAGVGDGLRRAWSLWPTILGYALIAATVGTILRVIAERVGFLGRIAMGLVGFAWTVATALVVPVLAAENVGPVDAVKRSTELIRRTWGEDIIGNAGIGLVFGLAMVLTVLVGGGLVVAAFATGSGALGVLAIVVTAVATALLALTQGTLHGIYAAALYRYANHDTATGPLDPAMLRDAFRAKA